MSPAARARNPAKYTAFAPVVCCLEAGQISRLTSSGVVRWHFHYQDPSISDRAPTPEQLEHFRGHNSLRDSPCDFQGLVRAPALPLGIMRGYRPADRIGPPHMVTTLGFIDLADLCLPTIGQPVLRGNVCHTRTFPRAAFRLFGRKIDPNRIFCSSPQGPLGRLINVLAYFLEA